MILVVGATGLVGTEVCLRLAARGKRVRALVRTTSDSKKIDMLKSAGVELCFGDLKEPQTLSAACQNVEAIISTASSTFSRAPGDSIESVDRAGQLNLVDAAKRAGVNRFIFVSFVKPEGVSVPLADAKAEVEQSISEMNFTIILASWFMEVWLAPQLGFDYANGVARVYGLGTSPITWVSYRDVAEMCVIALESPAAQRMTIEFGGPEKLSPHEVIKRFEKVSGRTFQVEHIPAETLYGQFTAATDPMEKSFAALLLGYAKGDAIDMVPIQQQFGIALSDVDTYVRHVLKT